MLSGPDIDMPVARRRDARTGLLVDLNRKPAGCGARPDTTMAARAMADILEDTH
jgi:hypothetical protein